MAGGPMSGTNNIPSNSVLVMAVAIGSYLSILHELGLNAITEALDNRGRKSIYTEDIIKTLNFVLQNNFEFNRKIKQQLSGRAIGTKCAPPFACIFMNKVGTSFLESQKQKTKVCFSYIDDIFFIWTHREMKLEQFLKEFSKAHPVLKFTH